MYARHPKAACSWINGKVPSKKQYSIQASNWPPSNRSVLFQQMTTCIDTGAQGAPAESSQYSHQPSREWGSLGMTPASCSKLPPLGWGWVEQKPAVPTKPCPSYTSVTIINAVVLNHWVLVWFLMQLWKTRTDLKCDIPQTQFILSHPNLLFFLCFLPQFPFHAIWKPFSTLYLQITVLHPISDPL